jgi:hypothetical protein
MTRTMTVAAPARAGAVDRAAGWTGGAAPFVIGGLLVGLVAADQGGYWPTAWGWTAIALAWTAGIALVLGATRIGRLGLAFVAGVTAFAGWTALSLLWTSSQTQTVLGVERTLVYVLAAAAVVSAMPPTAYRRLLWGVWAGSTSACLYGLATRLLPDRIGVTDALAGNRLAAPVGYWNGLGLLCALATLLALGLTAHGRPWPARAAAAASLPLLLPTLYLTFSRGAWLALAAGLVAAYLISPRRLGLLSATLVQAVPAAAAVWLVERAKPLHATHPTLAAATRDGHRLLWQLPLVAAGAAILALLWSLVAARWAAPTVVARAFDGLVATAAATALIAVVVHYGGPGGVVDHARRSIDTVAPGGGSDLNSRLLSLSSNGRLRQWHVALHEWRAHPVLGGGAGTYAEYWGAAAQNQPQLVNVHNLYLETLAELGPVGLVLLAAALAVPLIAAFRARHRSLVPIAAGVYVAFLVHAALDWDWQLTGVTLAALLPAGAALAAHERHAAAAPRSARWAVLAVVLAAGALSLVGLLGNRALARSGHALRHGNTAAAAAAANDARRWAPWSSQPWQQLAVIRTVAGDRAGARDAYRHAVAKDTRDWILWLGLAATSTGSERAHALARLQALHPSANGKRQ